jgi:ribonuclease BN (tRNA processing enzyme)
MANNIKITVVGSGNANSYLNANTSLLLTAENGENLLIDCGNRIPSALHELGIKPSAINAIYVSHPHGDHIGGLEEIALARYNWRDKPQHYSESPKPYAIKLYGKDELLDTIWNHALFAGLSTIEGVDADLATLFEPIAIRKEEDNDSFVWNGWQFDLIQQVHVMANRSFMLSYGLFMHCLTNPKEHKKVFFTTDCQWYQPKQIDRFYADADLIFQDCECAGINTVTRQIDGPSSGVHATFAEIAGWEAANARRIGNDLKGKILLEHYQDFVSLGMDYLGQPCDWDALAAEAGLTQGFVKVGQVFVV